MNFRRWTVCLVENHDWSRVPYGDHDDSGGCLRCRRCGYEDHHSNCTVSVIRPVGF